MSKEAGKVVIRGLARQLGINLTRRKTLQIIPVVGAAVGAGLTVRLLMTWLGLQGVFFRKPGLMKNMLWLMKSSLHLKYLAAALVKQWGTFSRIYEQVCEKLTGSTYYQSQLGGIHAGYKTSRLR
jgi:hypothetical protein